MNKSYRAHTHPSYLYRLKPPWRCLGSDETSPEASRFAVSGSGRRRCAGGAAAGPAGLWAGRPRAGASGAQPLAAGWISAGPLLGHGLGTVLDWLVGFPVYLAHLLPSMFVFYAFGPKPVNIHKYILQNICSPKLWNCISEKPYS